MDPKALYSISYGVFMLAVKSGERINGCITNTCMQVANDPARIAISCINTNLTCEMLKESGVFSLSILDSTCTFETISHFGLQSGRNTDKFADITLPEDRNGIPYLAWHTCSVLSCRVTESFDLGSHTLFIAEIEDAFRVSDNQPLTYSDYQTKLKPKPIKKDDREIIGWKCRICGFVYKGKDIPAYYLCPVCGHDKDDFEPVYKE